MTKTILTSALVLGSAAASQAAVIAVIDGGGPTTGDTAHSTITDLSTGGDNIGAMTGDFTSTGSSWRTNYNNYWNDTEFDFGPGDGNTATFTFGNMTLGTEVEVYATWREQTNRSTAAPYSIQGGADILINQELAPTAGLVLDDGTALNSSYNFQLLGTATVNGAGELVVTVGSAADDWVIPDAIAIKTVPEPSSAALLGLSGLALILRRRK